jgi:hypothetical protein
MLCLTMNLETTEGSQNKYFLLYIVSQVFCHSDEKTSTENWYQRSEVIAVTVPANVVQKP